jgi:uncharacterized membrane protein
MVTIALFVIAKFAAYSLFCAQAPKWFAFPEANTTSFGLRWGAARLVLGLAAGVPIAYLFALTEDYGLPLALTYAIILVLPRYLEWLILFKFLSWSRELEFSVRANTWIMMGVGVSLTLDFVALLFLEFGNVPKFFC